MGVLGFCGVYIVKVNGHGRWFVDTRGTSLSGGVPAGGEEADMFVWNRRALGEEKDPWGT